MRRLVSAIYLCLVVPVIAQEPLLNFEKNDFEEDIIYEQIEGVLIDADGFNWIGTTTGLYKYDGYSITPHYHNSQLETTISEDFVTSLFEDSHGYIWVGTYNNGLNIYDKRYQSFYKFRHDSTDDTSISTNRIPRSNRIIVEDNEGFIWLNTQNGLNKIDPDTKKVERHPGDMFGQTIFDKERNVLWIGSQGLKRYEPFKREIKSFGHGVSISAIVAGSSDFIWVGTNDGILLFKISENKFYHLEDLFDLSSSPGPGWSDEPVSCLYLDHKNNLWIGINNSIYILDTNVGTVKRLVHNQKEEYGLLDEKIRGIYGNKTGYVVVTYETEGVTIINTNVNKFRRINNIIEGSTGRGKKIVRSLLRDKNDNLWVGTVSNGLSKISGPRQKIQTFETNPDDPSSLNSNYITAIYIDKGDRMWIGTFEDGLNYSDNILQSNQPVFSNMPELKNIEIHEFTEDIAGRVWVSTNHGMYLYDKRTESITHYGSFKNQESLLKSINVQAVIYEPPNVFWLATWNSGVARLTINADPLLSGNGSSDELLILDTIRDEAGKLLDNRLINIFKDSKGQYWLASNLNGLIKMSGSGDSYTFKRYDETTGAPSNQVYAILEDQNSFIWVSTANGIGKLDPTTNHFTNYYESDGLLSNSLTWDSYYQDDSGEIYFGGFDGITVFHPDSLLSLKSNYQAYLKELVINHEPIHIGDTINKHFVLDRSIRYMESITLTHNESYISLEFGALNTTNPNDIHFAYKLDGFDKDWINTRSKNRTATYTNLEKGTYTFRIKAGKDLNTWNEEASLIIHVLPPWWKTTWANIIYLLAFGGLLYLFQKELNNRARMKSHLELEKYKHERDNQLNREKFQFFTTLSHELRTPLTLILGPLDRIINSKDVNNRVLKNLQLMHAQAQRLHKLTNQLMNFRKYEIENLKLKAAKGDIIQFLAEICLAFKQLAEMNQVDFRVTNEDDYIEAYYDRDKLEIIIVNLLSNAFKFTPQEGEVSLGVKSTSVSQAKHLFLAKSDSPKAVHGELPDQVEKVIQIRIADSGIGIPEDQLTRIFERYYQARNVQSLNTIGTGIGLEIVKNYVELHHGCIMVESKVHEGTTFHVWIPMGRSHLSDVDILQDFKPSEHEDHYRRDKDTKITNIQKVFSNDILAPVNEALPTLLIVDDNPDIVYYLKEIFEKDFNLITAQNGKNGLVKAFSNIPDLIISDIMMPEIDGLEFCRQIKTDIRTSHIPVILLTARNSVLFHSKGLETGADDFINKPFDEKILKLRVQNLIDSRKKLRERFAKESNLLPVDISITHPDEEFLNKVIGIIEKNIANSELKVELIAREVGMSHSVLYKKVMALTDLNIVEFIRTIRLKKAAKLLMKSDIPINRISQEVGFTDPKYFSKCFQKLYGETPSNYKNQHV
tara:strand:+ start:72099 stop:76301 length:4203 start_codon:yes stop_codon:yes gene_type:complete